LAYVINSNKKDLGGFSVSRIIPNINKRSVGPFVFVDHMGPAKFERGNGINVRPHPHIGLATISYLLEGSMLHRDSLGSIQEILPGDVNWMTAGKGIVHSERETIETRRQNHVLNGLQCWIALPEEKTEMEPSFLHIKKAQLPYIHDEKILMRLIAGEAYNYTSPVKTYSPMFYLDVVTEAGAVVDRPCGKSETACYIMYGELEIGGETYSEGEFVVLDDETNIKSISNCHYFLLGGIPMEKQPILKWNFLAYNPERIAKAEADWKAGKFPIVPGDDKEFIPLP
jgi:redox-sensitive bicupin YhaK (pirin superfamily)